MSAAAAATTTTTPAPTGGAAAPESFMQKVLDALQAMEARVTELEVKASYSDDLLEELNLIIYRQQQAMQRLAGDVNQLRAQLPQADAAQRPATAREDIPPHY